ncbi:MAG: acyl-CoA synthetase [Bacillota bacterium]
MTTSSLSLSRSLLVGELVGRAAHRTPHREAFIYGETRLTFSQLKERVLQMAGWFQQQGIGHNDKAGLMLLNGISFVEIFFGAALIGAVAVPINFRLTAKEVEYIVNNSDCKMLFIGKEYIELVQSIRNQLPKVEKIIAVEADMEFDNMISYRTVYETPTDYRPCEQLADDDPCLIMYTSGTTGRPKGAVLTHKNIYLNNLNGICDTKGEPHTKALSIVPMFHIAGLSTMPSTCLLSGTTVYQREFKPVEILKTIQEEKINGMFLVPSMWNMLFQVPDFDKYDVSSMQRCATGAAICPVELKNMIMQKFPNVIGIYEAFGQTEMSPATTYLQPQDSLRKTSSVGRPALTVEVRVVDDEMNDVPVGEVGEIVYRGPTVMKEYYNNPEATAESFKGGWFHSGDLVRMDEEGFVHVVDRKKDMIISGGENIYPAEVEEVIFNHPDILEVAVIGVPDEKWGETVKAFVVCKPGKSLTEEELINYCKEHLASYKKPKYVEFMNELPHNASGKVLKTALRAG